LGASTRREVTVAVRVPHRPRARDLISEHRASAKIQHAISELDLAIRDIRDLVFDHRRSE
jgi:tRNA A37 threonylcarbamoyladenosine synthetase subunit TsaC/SUA5/YrdC